MKSGRVDSTAWLILYQPASLVLSVPGLHWRQSSWFYIIFPLLMLEKELYCRLNSLILWFQLNFSFVPKLSFLCPIQRILCVELQAGWSSDKLDQLDFVWEITIVYQDKAQLGPLSCQHDRRGVKTSFISGQRDTVDRLYLMIWISGGSRGSRSWSPALKNEPNKSRGRAEGFLSGGEKSKHEQLQSGSWQTFGRKRLKTFGRETENISRLNEQK